MITNRKDWFGKFATVINTGEVVEVISYNSDTIQVKNSSGFTAEFRRDEVRPSTLDETAKFRTNTK